MEESNRGIATQDGTGMDLGRSIGAAGPAGERRPGGVDVPDSCGQAGDALDVRRETGPAEGRLIYRLYKMETGQYFAEYDDDGESILLTKVRKDAKRFNDLQWCMIIKWELDRGGSGEWTVVGGLE